MDPIINTVFVGIDVHKYSHTAVCIDCFNREQFSIEFTNKEIDKFIKKLSLHKDKELLIGLEDTNGYGRKLSNQLTLSGLNVFHVPSKMVDRQKDNTVHKEKSDYIDAMGVAQVILYNQKTLPQEIITERTQISNDLDGLVNDRESLTKNQTRLKNQLHILLHSVLGDDYKGLVKGKNVMSIKNLKIYEDILFSRTDLESRRAVRKIKELILTLEQLDEIDEDLETLTKDNKDIKSLESIEGCGKLTAYKILAEIKDIRRFKTPAKLSRYAGVSPLKNSSGGRGKPKMDKAGNRKLNRALYTIALTQTHKNSPGKYRNYYDKKLKEGKSKIHSIRCMKRHIVNRIYKLLTQNLT